MADFKGIDVSHWQGEIDWEKVKHSGIHFAMIRVGSSTKLDAKFVKNIKAALDQDIKCGTYLYSYATSADEAVKEAKFVLESIKPYDFAYPVAYDIEDKSQRSLTVDKLTQVITAFLDEIAAADYKPAIYSNISWFETKFDLSKLVKYDKWIAAWRDTPPKFEGYQIWQNSSTGTIPGISGHVDTNISYKDY